MKFVQIFVSREDAIGFVEIMRELANADEAIDKSEEKLIQNFIKFCNLN